MIELGDIRFDYQDMRMAFDLSVAAGEFVTVIGPSGAGKSTLLNLIAGFDRPVHGYIRLGGADVTDWRPADRPVTTLFQDHNVFAHMTVRRNVGLGRHPGLRLSPADRADVAAALDRVGLAGLEERMPGQLSGGERQRVALARSLVRHRPILLLDEPFAALGPAQRREMIQLVDTLRTDQGLTVMMVTHQIDDLRAVRGRALFVAAGRIIADAAIGTMLDHPPGPEVAAYLGA